MLQLPLVTAHRGSSGAAPENTLAALRQAIVDGADMAEVDVQLTADGELVLLHDLDLLRVAGDPRCLADLTYQQIRQLEVGRWFGPAFAGEPVPRLVDAIALVRGRLRLNLELKASWADPRLARSVVALLTQCQFEAGCLITSFDPDLLRQVRGLAPQLELGLIIEAVPSSWDSQLSLYSIDQAIATPALIRQIQSRRQAVHVWTVNQPADMLRLRQHSVDSIITDHPKLLRQVLQTAPGLGL